MSDIERAWQRENWSLFFQIIRHPSRASELIKTLITRTKDYYSARDAVELESAQVIRLLSTARTLAIEMSGMTVFLLILLIVCLATHARADKWTPEDFNWTALRELGPPQEEWKGLYVNLTEHPVETHAALRALGRYEVLDGHGIVVLQFLAGISISVRQAVSFVVTVAGIGSAIDGCVTNDGSPNSVIECVIGVAGTAAGIGLAYKPVTNAIKGWRAVAANGFDGSGLENIALDVFSKRSQDMEQTIHELTMREILRRDFGSEPEFLGYAHQDHYLKKRGDEYLHPEAPIFRFNHPRHGSMDVASRRQVNATVFTMSYSKQAEIDKTKRQSYDHETFTQEVMMARFDEEAAMSDPSNPTFDAAAGYQQLEDSLSCFLGQNGNTWPAGNVVDMQMYDASSESTFGFVTMGIVDQDTTDTENDIDGLTPTGMPLPVPTC